MQHQYNTVGLFYFKNNKPLSYNTNQGAIYIFQAIYLQPSEMRFFTRLPKRTSIPLEFLANYTFLPHLRRDNPPTPLCKGKNSSCKTVLYYGKSVHFTPRCLKLSEPFSLSGSDQTWKVSVSKVSLSKFYSQLKRPVRMESLMPHYLLIDLRSTATMYVCTCNCIYIIYQIYFYTHISHRHTKYMYMCEYNIYVCE